MIVQVPDEFSEYADGAVVRLNYLFPNYTFTVTESAIEVEAGESPAVDLPAIKKEIFFQLYRQKIFSDTLPIRKWLYSDE